MENDQEELNKHTQRYELRQRTGFSDVITAYVASDLHHAKRVMIMKIQLERCRSYEELQTWRLMFHLHGNQNNGFLELYDMFISPPTGGAVTFAQASESHRAVFVVLEYFPVNLSRVLRAAGQPLVEDHFRYFLYQMLCILTTLHQAGVVHGKLRPIAFCVNEACDLKMEPDALGVPGLQAISPGCASDDLLRGRVEVHRYLAPEVLLDQPCGKWTAAADVWSLGCIFGEMIKRVDPLFKGYEPIRQWKSILELTGTPTEEELTSLAGIPEATINYVRSCPTSPPTKTIADLLPDTAHPDAIDLLQQMLRFDPRKRISVVEAMRHPYLAELHDREDETPCIAPFDAFFEGLTRDNPFRNSLHESDALVMEKEFRLLASRIQFRKKWMLRS